MRFANVTDRASSEAAQVLTDVAKKESGGLLVIKHYPNNMLGDDRAAAGAVMKGDIDMVQLEPAALADKIPDLYAWEAPFVFETPEEAYKCLDGPLGQAVNDQAQDLGLKFLTAPGQGFRHYTDGRGPVRLPSDLQGEKLRVAENGIDSAVWENFGADPSPLPRGETLSALQQGLIEAQEAPLSVIEKDRLYELQHYISLTGHVYAPFLLYINKAKYDSLSPELKQALNNAVTAYKEARRYRARQLDALTLSKFKEAGCEVSEITAEERQQWRQKAMDGQIYEQIRQKMSHPEYLNMILGKEY